MSQVNISVREYIDENIAVIGNDSDTACSYSLLNKARNIAYPLGDWVGTVEYYATPIASGGLFVLPSRYSAIRGARSMCGNVLDLDTGHIAKDNYFTCDPSPVLVKSVGRTFLPFQLTENSPLTFFAVNNGDIGVNVRVQYQDIRGTRYDDTISLLHHTPTELRHRAAKVLRITKPRTRGAVSVNAGDSYGYIEEWDTNPTYTTYCAECSGCVALEVKKRNIPYTIDNADDVLDINPEALTSLIVAVKARDSGADKWINEYNAAVQLAVGFLKQELTSEDMTNKGMIVVQAVSNFMDELAWEQSK